MWDLDTDFGDIRHFPIHSRFHHYSVNALAYNERKHWLISSGARGQVVFTDMERQRDAISYTKVCCQFGRGLMIASGHRAFYFSKPSQRQYHDDRVLCKLQLEFTF